MLLFLILFIYIKKLVFQICLNDRMRIYRNISFRRLKIYIKKKKIKYPSIVDQYGQTIYDSLEKAKNLWYSPIVLKQFAASIAGLLLILVAYLINQYNPNNYRPIALSKSNW